MAIYTNEYLEITEENGKVFLKTFKTGFSLKEFDEILTCHPRLKLLNFALLKSVLSKETPQPTEIGIWLPSIQIEIDDSKMSATMVINESKEYIQGNKESLLKSINSMISEKKIVHGIMPIDLTMVQTGKTIEIAKGTNPISGQDAQVRYLEIPERKPIILEDGRANYFDMNFFVEITEGTWLGEKIPAQLGISGINILGETVQAQPGKDVPLKYDRHSAMEVEEDGKIVLRSTQKGVLEQRQGLLTISRHLPIDGDVGIETGNIEFDGSITIKGTIQNGFKVIATGDISIEHLEGVTGAKLIHSKQGDVYIRGGVFGLGETLIEAGKNIFVKHVNEANLIAGEEIVIGSYALSSNLSANKILVDERKGKIIGGRVVAKDTIITAITGNRLERRTELIVDSISKQKKQEIIKEKASLLKRLNDEILQLSSQLNSMTIYKEKMTENQLAAFQQVEKQVEKKKMDAGLLDAEIKQLMNELRQSTKEEIIVRKEALPGTYLQIGKKSTVLSKITNGAFRLENGELNV
nr:FapA family protein [Lysinibacillus timonensis]